MIGRRTLRFAALAAALASSVPSLAHAGGFTIVEMGTRKTGMGAVIGRPDDSSAVYHNPAGLVLQDGLRLYTSVGLAWINSDFKLRAWGRSTDFIKAPVDSQGFFPALEPAGFGAIPMLVISSNLYRNRIYGALSFYVPNAIGASFDTEVGRYHLGTSYLVAGFVTATVAARITDWLSIGAGVSAAYVRIFAQRKLYPILNNGTQDLSGLLGPDSDLTLNGEDVRPGFNVGILLTPFKRLTIGAAIISRTDMTLEGDVKVDFGDGSPAKGRSLEGTQKTALLIPWSFHFGANLDITRWLEIGVEFRFWTYSALDEQRSEVEDIDIITELVVPKDYGDSWQLSGGVIVRPPMLPNLELMAGFHYDYSPAPDSNISLDQPSFFHAGLHMGARYSVGRYRFALTYAHYWYFTRDVTDSKTDPPSNFLGNADNNMLTLVFEVRWDLIGTGAKKPAPTASARVRPAASASASAPTAAASAAARCCRPRAAL